MLEKMSDFFENRLDGYDEHMLTCIEAAREFYPYTAHCSVRDRSVVRSRLFVG